MDPTQQGEVRLHSWPLYTSQALVLDLTNKSITTTTEFSKLLTIYTCALSLIIKQHMVGKQLERNEKCQKIEIISDIDTADN